MNAPPVISPPFTIERCTRCNGLGAEPGTLDQYQPPRCTRCNGTGGIARPVAIYSLGDPRHVVAERLYHETHDWHQAYDLANAALDALEDSGYEVTP